MRKELNVSLSELLEENLWENKKAVGLCKPIVQISSPTRDFPPLYQ
jgi:hypothetical protein